MNYILIVFGAWIAFDGIVSETYFAKYVDHSTKSWKDQAIRIVRTAVGIGVIIIGAM